MHTLGIIVGIFPNFHLGERKPQQQDGDDNMVSIFTLKGQHLGNMVISFDCIIDEIRVHLPSSPRDRRVHRLIQGPVKDFI